MKRISFFSTPFYMFLTEIPFVVILVLSIIYNPYAEGWARLYPLITVMAAAIVFSNIFLFRGIRLSRCEIRDVGRFSPRDHARLEAGNSIRLQVQNGGKVRIYVYGKAGLPELDWMRDQTTNPDEICMYRGRTLGGIRTVADILSYFGVPEKEIEAIIRGKEFCENYSECTVTVDTSADGSTQYSITLLRTVLELDPEVMDISRGTELSARAVDGGEWETVIVKDGEHISTHRSRRIKKQLSKLLSEYEVGASDIRELFSGADSEINLDLIHASARDGAYTVRIK